MVTVLGLLAAGMLLGFYLRKKESLVPVVDSLTTGAIYLLLFLLGLSVGANRIITDNMGTIGLQASLLAAGSIAGSVILSTLLEKALFTSSK